MVKKSAFTLIELIFAIVIIAISVVSLPMMNQAISKGINANLLQEAIFAASTKLNEAVTARWDENSLEITDLDGLARVIDDGRCENNTSSVRYRRKPGHIRQKLHRRCLDSNTTLAYDGSGSTNNVVDLDDMRSTNVNLTTTNTVGQAGYKQNYKVDVRVTRGANFGMTNNNPNIKQITVDIKDETGKIIVSLKTYSANIGEIDYTKRPF